MESISSLLEKNYNKLLKYSLYLTRDKDTAEDLLQEVALKILSKEDMFEKGTNFEAWSTTIIRNSFLNNIKRKSRITRFPLDLKIDLYDSKETDSDINIEDLNKLIDSLGKSKSFFLKRYLSGLTYEELSKEFEIPKGTVRSKIFNIRKILKEKIKVCY